MNPQSPRILREVIRTIPTPSGEQIAAVVCGDGTLGIARDGALLESLRWEPEEREQCLAFLERFARTTAGDPYFRGGTIRPDGAAGKSTGDGDTSPAGGVV